MMMHGVESGLPVGVVTSMVHEIWMNNFCISVF